MSGNQSLGGVPPRGRSGLRAVLAGTLLATTVAVAGPVPAVFAATGTVSLLDKIVNPTTTSGSPAMPGDTLTFTIAYDCSGLSLGDDCAGAVLSDPLPTFQDIYGTTAQLEFVSATFTAPNDWTFQGISGVAPNQVATWDAVPQTANSCTPPGNDPNVGLCAGDSGAVVLELRVPVGIVPATVPSQVVTNTATVELTGQADDDSTTTTSYINSLSPPGSTLSKSGPSTVLLNAAGTDEFTYTINICPQTDRPLYPGYTVTDVLPVGVTVVTPVPYGGVYTPGTPSTEIPPVPPALEPTLVPGTGGTIEWEIDELNLPPRNPANGCLQISFDVSFINKFAVGGDLSNVIGAQKVNSVSAVGHPETGPDVGIGPATTTATLNGPVTRFGPSKDTDGNYYVDNAAPDNVITYRLGARNTSDAEAVPFSTATLTDGAFPAAFTLTEIHTGSWDGTVTGSVETSPDGSNWTQVSTAENATINSGLGGVQYVRWVFTSPGAPEIGPGWNAVGQELVGTISGAPTETLSNCARLEGVQADVPQNRGDTCADVLLEVPQPHPSVTKSAPSTLEPGDTITYTLVAANDDDATDVLVDPQLTDCVPFSSHLVVSNLLAGGSPLPTNGWSIEAFTVGGCTPTSPNTANSGTLLQLQYTGTLNPGEAASTITYDVTADAFEFPTPSDSPTPPGNYVNTVNLTEADGDPFGHCVQANCSASDSVQVPVIAQLQSQKLVRGALDREFNKAGTTTPGGQVTWKLSVQNVGNVEVESTTFVDIFSFVGDRGVRVTTLRGSEYVPYLVDPISAPPGWTVEYSTSSDPCRPEVLGPNSSCTPPNWTATPNLAALSTYKSIRLSYAGRLAIGASLEFEYDQVTPVFDPTYDDDTANPTASPYDALDNCTIPNSQHPWDPGDVLDFPGDSTLDATRGQDDAWVDGNADGVQQLAEGGPTCPRASNSFAYGVDVPTDQLNGLDPVPRLGAEPPRSTCTLPLRAC